MNMTKLQQSPTPLSHRKPTLAVPAQPTQFNILLDHVLKPTLISPHALSINRITDIIIPWNLTRFTLSWKYHNPDDMNQVRVYASFFSCVSRIPFLQCLLLCRWINFLYNYLGQQVLTAALSWNSCIGNNIWDSHNWLTCSSGSSQCLLLGSKACKPTLCQQWTHTKNWYRKTQKPYSKWQMHVRMYIHYIHIYIYIHASKAFSMS